MLDKKKEWLIIGNSSFLISYLKDVNMTDAIKRYKGTCHEDRIRNAWKQANNKK